MGDPSNRDRVPLGPLDLDPLTADATLDLVFDALREGRGGILLTANLDILRRATNDAEARALYRSVDVTVADGMPLVWASRVAGTPLPMRVAGSSLVAPLAERAAREGRSIFLLGGDGSDADVAAAALRRDHPGLVVAGVLSPHVSTPPSPADVEALARTLEAARADLVLVALGSPKQEALAAALRPRLPRTWFLGVGISLAFVSGRIARAPSALQAVGLEWVHRLVQEPRRLARRYLVDGLPFAARLLGGALVTRLRSGRS